MAMAASHRTRFMGKPSCATAHYFAESVNSVAGEALPHLATLAKAGSPKSFDIHLSISLMNYRNVLIDPR